MGIDTDRISVSEAPAAEPVRPPAPAEPPAYAPAPAPAVPAAAAPQKKARPGWVLAAAVGAVGLVACGSLGYLFNSAGIRLDATRHQLTAAQLDLDGKNKALASERAQAAYVAMYDQDLGRFSTDFGLLTACDSVSSCRSAAQSMLSDTQAFQADRESAKVPGSLTGVDGTLGNGLTTEVTALQNLLAALDSSNADHIQGGFAAVNDATIGVFRTEPQLAALVQ